MGTNIDDMEVLGSVIAADFTTASNAVYVDVTGASVAVPVVTEDPTRTDSYGMLDCEFTCVLSKATAGSARVALFVNGAILADSVTDVTNAQGAQRVTFSALVPRAALTAQTVKLQAQSVADANTVTVAKPRLTVRRLRLPGGVG